MGVNHAYLPGLQEVQHPEYPPHSVATISATALKRLFDSTSSWGSMAQASLPAQTLQGLPQQALNGLFGLWWPLEADPCQPHLLPPSPSAHLAPASGCCCFLNTLSILPAAGPLHMCLCPRECPLGTSVTSRCLWSFPSHPRHHSPEVPSAPQARIGLVSFLFS